MKTSPNVGLNIPEGSDVFNHDTFLKQNFEKIDNYLINTEEIPNINAQLDQKANKTDLANEVASKRNHLETLTADTVIPFEIHNQSKQTTGGQSSEVTHHYNDATAKVIDNVGTGTILMLSNSQNTIMRPDKDSNYVGSGNVLLYRLFNNTTKVYDTVLTIDQNGNISRTKLGNSFYFTSNKPSDDGFPGFTFDNSLAQVTAFNFRNGGSLLTFNDESSKTKTAIVSGAGKTTGMEVRASAGDLYLRADVGTVKAYDKFAANYYTVQTAINGTTASRPTGILVGYQYFDTTLGKPIWYKGSSQWVDAMGTVV